MKKLFVILIIIMILVFNLKQQHTFSLLDYFSGEYIAYSSTKSVDSVDLGFCYMNTKTNVKNVIGESIKIDNFEPINALKLLNAKVIKTEYLDDGTAVIYAISNKIKEKVLVDNKYVNLQIAHKDDYSVIGWPLILGSF